MEKMLYKNSYISIIKAKNFSESLSQEVSKLEELGSLTRMNQNDRLKELKSKTDIDESGLAIFNKTRRVVNMSVFNKEDDIKAALLLHRCSYDLTCWFVSRYIDSEFKCGEYISPIQNMN